MYQDLKGKTALVTGSGKKSGIGFAVAQKLAESGANIIIADLLKMDDRGRPPASPLLSGSPRRFHTGAAPPP